MSWYDGIGPYEYLDPVSSLFFSLSVCVHCWRVKLCIGLDCLLLVWVTDGLTSLFCSHIELDDCHQTEDQFYS